MTWIFEQPLLLVLLSVAILSGIAITWVMSGQKAFLYVLIVGVLIAAGLIVAERMVVTDRETIQATLEQMARDVASNDQAKVMQHIATSATAIQQQAKSELPRYKFDSMRITQVHKIDVRDTQSPRTATVEFNVMAAGSFQAGADLISSNNVPRWVQLELVKEPDGAWRITDYQHEAPQHFMLQLPTSP